MTFTALLNHTAILQGIVQMNAGGRVTNNTVMTGSINCRFASPSTAYQSVFGTEYEQSLDALVYCDYIQSDSQKRAFSNLPYPNLAYLNWNEFQIDDMSDISSDYFFLRLITQSEGWNGEYQVSTPIRFCDGFCGVHHCEFGIKRIY